AWGVCKLHTPSLPDFPSIVIYLALKVIAAMMTTFSYLMMTGYDAIALHHIRPPLPYRQVAFVVFTSAAISSSVGFAFLVSSAIRYRLYSAWG
ncbi:MAG: hypothetical protein BRC57_08800, partial [Cyanobacteria bacterium QS_8_48_54]